MRYILLMMLLTSCTTTVSTLKDRCIKRTHDANTEQCDGSVQSTCSYIDFEVECDALRF